MRRKATGKYAASVAGGETVRAFVPFPLPPTPPLELSGAHSMDPSTRGGVTPP